MKILDPDVIAVKVTEDCEFCSYCHKSYCDLGLGRYGPLFKLKDITVHYFCLLFSENLNRRSDEDDKGIFGFAYEDIKVDLDQGLEKMCKHCGKNRAAIQCSENADKVQHVDAGNEKRRKTNAMARCTSNFHYPCARDAGVRFKFSNKFTSLCNVHASKAKEIPVESSWKCPICYEPAQIDILIKTRCCRPNPGSPDERIQNIFHMSCLQRSAWTCGTKHFRCPTCRGTDAVFIEQMKSSGIYVPISDVDYLVEEEDEEAENSEILPQPIVSSQVVKNKQWEFYSIYMKNGVYSSNEILLSIQTPWPKPIFRNFPEENLEWKELTRGGACFPAPSPTSNDNCQSGFLRLQPTQRRRIKKAKTGCFKLVLLVYKGTLRMEYSYRGSKFTGLLPSQSVASIQPGLSYSLENETDDDVVIFYIFKKMGNDRRNWDEAHCQLIEAKELIWASPMEPGSPVGIKRCFTGETHHQGFVKIPPLTCTRFAMNKFGPTVYFVVSGEVILRSSKFEDDKNSSDEDDDDDEDNDGDDQNDVRSRCLASEVYKEGSSFEIPYKCCFVIENWDESVDPDRPPACLFYDIMDP